MVQKDLARILVSVYFLAAPLLIISQTMPPKRKSEVATMADESANTPSKRARNAATKAVASSVSASFRGLTFTIQPLISLPQIHRRY